MRIRITRHTIANGGQVAPGDIIDTDDISAAMLIRMSKAEPVMEEGSHGGRLEREATMMEPDETAIRPTARAKNRRQGS